MKHQFRKRNGPSRCNFCAVLDQDGHDLESANDSVELPAKCGILRLCRTAPESDDADLLNCQVREDNKTQNLRGNYKFGFRLPEGSAEDGPDAIIVDMSNTSEVILPKIAQERLNRLETPHRQDRSDRARLRGIAAFAASCPEAGFKVTGFDIDARRR